MTATATADFDATAAFASFVAGAIGAMVLPVYLVWVGPALVAMAWMAYARATQAEAAPAEVVARVAERTITMTLEVPLQALSVLATLTETPEQAQMGAFTSASGRPAVRVG